MQVELLFHGYDQKNPTGGKDLEQMDRWILKSPQYPHSQ